MFIFLTALATTSNNMLNISNESRYPHVSLNRWEKAFNVSPLSMVLAVASFFFINLFILFLAALGLRCCTQAFSSCGERGLLFFAVRELIAVASLIAEHGL